MGNFLFVALVLGVYVAGTHLLVSAYERWIG